MPARPRLVSGIKPTGPLHLGNLVGALWPWRELQDSHEAFLLVADWHAYTAAGAAPVSAPLGDR